MPPPRFSEPRGGADEISETCGMSILVQFRPKSFVWYRPFIVPFALMTVAYTQPWYNEFASALLGSRAGTPKMTRPRLPVGVPVTATGTGVWRPTYWMLPFPEPSEGFTEPSAICRALVPTAWEVK